MLMFQLCPCSQALSPHLKGKEGGRDVLGHTLQCSGDILDLYSRIIPKFQRLA